MWSGFSEITNKDSSLLTEKAFVVSCVLSSFYIFSLCETTVNRTLTASESTTRALRPFKMVLPPPPPETILDIIKWRPTATCDQWAGSAVRQHGLLQAVPSQLRLPSVLSIVAAWHRPGVN